MRSFVQHKTTPSPTSAAVTRGLLLALWLASAGAMTLALISGVSQARGVAALASLGFVVTLIVDLVRAKPHAADLPDLPPLVGPRLSFHSMAAAISLGILLLLAGGLVLSPGVSLLAGAALIATGMLLAWRGQASRRVVLVGLAAGSMTGLGIRFLEQGELAWAIINGLAIPPVFVVGALLMQRSRLGQVRLLAGEYRRSLRGFLWSCALAVPAAILNLIGNVQAGDTWIVYWWQPLAALDPAIAEEIWARLFLTTLVYTLLRPPSRGRPGRALFAAVLLSALAHAFAHAGINPIGLVIGGLLYGVPTGLLFVRRDLEHALGYHFLIDFLRYLAALLTPA